ncbi:MAG: regulatory protein RecX [Chthonomonadales bacterium]
MLAEGFIDYQPRTSSEVRRRLLRAGFDEAVVEEVVRDLEDAGLLDDARFCREWVESRSRSKGLGPRRLTEELLRKGVPREKIVDALQPLDADAQMERALELARRRLERLDLKDPATRTKVAGYLRRRGYDWDCVEQVCAILMPNN